MTPAFLSNSKRGHSLFLRITDSLQKRPWYSISSPDSSSTAFMPRRAPASTYADRLGLWQGSPSGGHEIGVSPTISPNLIALLVNYGALATVTVKVADGWRCSWRWVIVQLQWTGRGVRGVLMNARTRNRGTRANRNRAGDGELGFTMAEIGFGGNSEFEHTSGWLWPISGGWLA
jgi:hypothetical protein